MPDPNQEMMRVVSTPSGWGPSHQTTRRQASAGVRWVGVAIAVGGTESSDGWVKATILGAILIVVVSVLNRRGRPRRAAVTLTTLTADAPDALAAIRDYAVDRGVYLGVSGSDEPRFAEPERAVLVLGPPRSGKSTAVIVPAVLAHTGPVVCTSTKDDVTNWTGRSRRRNGRVWMFDLTRPGAPPGGVEARWSPVTSARSWEHALLTARAMTATVGAGTTHSSHWANRAQALLAPMPHAAAIDGRDVETVADWVMRHELDQPGTILEHDAASRLAFGSLVGIYNTDPRERASIFSSAADALVAYNSEAAIDRAKNPNFDPAAFVQSQDTVYITSPAEDQAAAAPIICGLLSEIRRAAYRAHRNQTLTNQVLFALDEAANIAPLDELPAIASEGGGQGLTLIAAFQDLSQARKRWGEAADGFLTLFGTKVIFPGISDTKTLDTISTTLGEYDRQVISRTRPDGFIAAYAATQRGGATRTTTTSTQRTRVLSSGEIANIPHGRILHLDGVAWELITATPVHTVEPWTTIATTPLNQ